MYILTVLYVLESKTCLGCDFILVPWGSSSKHIVTCCSYFLCCNKGCAFVLRLNSPKHVISAP